ncbi:MAG TPA: phosphoesterase [Ruminococcaceae bacterium]|nr:phosphoesterase [Oscillospiraceae bacterium]
MKKDYSYDLHIHSCLSPCGDDDMTVNNIVNMAQLNGIDIIALTDHNTCKNCPAFIKAAKDKKLLALSGMELCTSEEIHIICLFPSLDNAMAFDSYVYTRLPNMQNNPGIFGQQLILNENDEIIGREDKLLINAADISVAQISGLMCEFGGFAFPAHIDKNSFSILSVLGFIPPEYGFTAFELSNSNRLSEYKISYFGFCSANIIVNSDAHYLWDISEGENSLTLDEKSYNALIKCLSNN